MTRPGFPAVDGEFGREGAFETELEWEEEVVPGAVGAPAGAAAASPWRGGDQWNDGNQREDEDEWELENAWEAEDEWEAEAEDEVEFDFEAEYERMSSAEGEDFANPVRRIYPDAELMAHLAHRAATARSDGEAEAFIGALVPLAARLVPRAAAVLHPAVPTLIRGARSVVRSLRRDPALRPLTDAVPLILQRTAQSIADQVLDDGRDLDGGLVLDTLGQMAGRVLGTPRSRQRAVRAVRAFDPAARRRVPTRTPEPGARQRAVARRRGGTGGQRRGRRV